MNIRLLILTYMVAFFAGAIFKTLLYIIQPESVDDLNSTVLELTIVSALVAAGVSIFYMFKAKQREDEK